MSLNSKVKTALDETRTLMLGAQILLGFPLHGAFQERFGSLSPQAKIIDAIALLLILSSVGLLIAPSAFHRIVDRGESTGRTLVITSICAAASLLPFAVALGIDLSIALMRILQSSVLGIVSGASFALMGLAAWYGLGWIMKSHQGATERQQAVSGTAEPTRRTCHAGSTNCGRPSIASAAEYTTSPAPSPSNTF